MNTLKPIEIAESTTTNGRRTDLRIIERLGEGAETPAVKVSQLRKTYPGGVEAVKGIDFEVAPGEVFGLLGPNGAGKSTTIGMLTTTVQPTSGSAQLAGYDVAKQPLLARSVSSVVFQDAVVDRALSGRANLDLQLQRWPATAPRDRSRPGLLAEGSVSRRADRRPGPQDPPRAARRDRGAAQPRGHDDPRHHSLPR
jgi:ABC-type glutathione transport system ATPase component